MQASRSTGRMLRSLLSPVTMTSPLPGKMMYETFSDASFFPLQVKKLLPIFPNLKWHASSMEPGLPRKIFLCTKHAVPCHVSPVLANKSTSVNLGGIPAWMDAVHSSPFPLLLRLSRTKESGSHHSSLCRLNRLSSYLLSLLPFSSSRKACFSLNCSLFAGSTSGRRKWIATLWHLGSSIQHILSRLGGSNRRRAIRGAQSC